MANRDKDKKTNNDLQNTKKTEKQRSMEHHEPNKYQGWTQLL